MTPEERYNKLLVQVLNEGVVIEPKAAKWYWRAVGKLLMVISFGKIDFMDRFHSTFGNRIGVSPSWPNHPDSHKYIILLHEMTHVAQYKRFGFGNVWVGWVLVSIAYLLLPLPIGLAWCRAAIEKEGYEASIRAYVQIYGREYSASQKTHIVEHFTGVNYMFMWPFKESMNIWYDTTLERICDEEGV